MTERELDGMRAEIDAAATDPGCTFYQARIHQVLGVRPGFGAPGSWAAP